MACKLYPPFGIFWQFAAVLTVVLIIGAHSSALAVTKAWSVSPMNYEYDTTSINWIGGSGVFINGDPVQFTDGGSDAFPIVLMGALVPASVTVNVTNNHYFLSGSGALGGSGGLIKNGTGILTFSNTGLNTFTGGTTINGGTLEITTTNGYKFGQGSLLLANDATLSMHTGMANWSNNVSGTGLWQVGTGMGSQSTILAGDYSAFHGILEAATGGAKIVLSTSAKYPAADSTLKIDLNTTAYIGGGGTFWGIIQMYGGTTGESLGQLRLGGTAGITLKGPVTLFGNTSIGVNSGQVATISGNIGGNFGFTKLSAGTLILAGTNTYAGNTVISAGTLRLATAGLPSGLQIMPLGDSITFGTGGNDAGYRGPLYDQLAPVAAGFYFVGSSVQNPGLLPTNPIDETHNEGHSSYTISDVDNNLDGFDNATFLEYGGAQRDPNGGYWLIGGNSTGRPPLYPDVILLLIGANDLSEQTGISNRLDKLVSKITTLRPTTTLVMAKITPYSGSTNVDSYNAIVTSVVKKYQAQGSRVSLADLNTGFPSDGLPTGSIHPNAVGYSWMAGQWFDAILAVYSWGSMAIPGTSPTTVAMGATLDINGAQAAVGPLVGAGDITLGSVTTAVITINSPVGHDSTFSGVISGAGGVVKNGDATLTLSGSNSYNGLTTIGGGVLQVNGALAGGGVVVLSGGTLGGVGTIGGPVTVQNGGILSAGASLGTLRINHNLTIGGNVVVTINKSASPASNLTMVSGILTNAGSGTVTVNNVGGAVFVAGDHFQVFNQALLNGQVLSVTPRPGAGLAWSNQLAVDGSLVVVTAEEDPVAATNLVIAAAGSGRYGVSGVGGANQAYGLYASTNLSGPGNDWWLIGTTNADTGGGIQFLDTQATNAQRFYRFAQ